MIYVLMHYTESFKPLVDISKPILKEYCKAHGYLLSIRQVDQYQRYTGIDKLQHVDDILRMGDVALVLDADCLITNFFTKIEDLLDSEYDLFLSHGLNMGAFIIRKTEKTKSLLIDCIKKVYLGEFNCEQDFIESEISKHDFIKVLPHPCFNSYPCNLYPEHGNTRSEQGCWEEGSFICHVPGKSMNERVRVFEDILSKIVR